MRPEQSPEARTPTRGSAPELRWGLCPQIPAASPSQKSWIRHCYW